VFPENIAMGLRASHGEHDGSFSSSVILNSDLSSKLHEAAILANMEDRK
jgi:hypothetical protein